MGKGGGEGVAGLGLFCRCEGVTIQTCDAEAEAQNLFRAGAFQFRLHQCEAVLLLDGAPGSVANFHLWFLAGYAVKLGFMPGETVEPPGLFDPRGDTLFHRLLESPFEDAMAIPLSSERRRDFSRSMLRYLSWHLGVNIEARSLEVLHEVLG